MRVFVHLYREFPDMAVMSVPLSYHGSDCTTGSGLGQLPYVYIIRPVEDRYISAYVYLCTCRFSVKNL